MINQNQNTYIAVGVVSAALLIFVLSLVLHFMHREKLARLVKTSGLKPAELRVPNTKAGIQSKKPRTKKAKAPLPSADTQTPKDPGSTNSSDNLDESDHTYPISIAQEWDVFISPQVQQTRDAFLATVASLGIQNLETTGKPTLKEARCFFLKLNNLVEGLHKKSKIDNDQSQGIFEVSTALTEELDVLYNKGRLEAQDPVNFRTKWKFLGNAETIAVFEKAVTLLNNHPGGRELMDFADTHKITAKTTQDQIEEIIESLPFIPFRLVLSTHTTSSSGSLVDNPTLPGTP